MASITLLASIGLRSGVVLTAALAAIFMPYADAGATGIQTTQSSVPPAKHGASSCLPVSEAINAPNKDVCVQAHVYNVVELADGTRFLDVCPPDIPDDQCRFTLVSLRADRDDVGDLRKYRDQEVQLRGIVRATHGRMGIVISHVRQFNGGPEKFRPNPRLLRDFNGQSNRMPIRDPNLSGSGRHRSFMNSSDRETLPEAKH